MSGQNKFGIMQILRFIRNGFIMPTRFQAHHLCPLCGDAQFDLAHICVCSMFGSCLKKALHEQAKNLYERAGIRNDGNRDSSNSHILIRLLLALPKISLREKLETADVFAAAGLLINELAHTTFPTRSSNIIRLIKLKTSQVRTKPVPIWKLNLKVIP